MKVNQSSALRRAEDAFKANPFDFEACNVFLRNAQNAPIEEARHVYESLINKHKNSVRFWTAYIEHEMKAERCDKVAELLQRCMLNVVHIDIWKLYLVFVKKTKATLPGFKEIMVKTYDFALDKVGVDFKSYPLWKEYIEFLESLETIGSYAENQKMEAIRKVYQKGIMTPMANSDLLWKDYFNFETKVNPVQSKKIQEERGSNQAFIKKIVKDIEKFIKIIDNNIQSHPPQNTPEEIKQIEQWEQYIKREKSNPLNDDEDVVVKRVMYAYEQFLLRFGFHPQVWIDAVSYLENSRTHLSQRDYKKITVEEVNNIYERALSAGLENCPLVHFSYADLEESRKNYAKVHSIYKKALEVKSIETTLVYVQYMRFARRAEGITSARNVFKEARNDPGSKCHVYVEAALSESRSNVDRDAALKIFELGFKKFGKQYEFVKEFLEFSTNAGDLKYTKELFERVITAGVEPREKLVDIWNKFVEFQANTGIISGIVNWNGKQEKLFGKTLESAKTLDVITKYTFCDLVPCSPSDIEALGLTKSSEGTDSSLKKTSVPEIGNILTLKPKEATNNVAPIVLKNTNIQPPPTHFVEFFNNINKVLTNTLKCPIPNDFSRPSQSKVENRQIQMGFVSSKSLNNNLKRQRQEIEDDDDDCVISDNPPNNIFVSRQRKRMMP